MVPWWKRLIYSLVSVVAAVMLCLAVIFLSMMARGISGHPYSRDFLIALGEMLACCIPGWILSLPLVLVARSFHGRRGLWLWVAGSLIGPVFLLAIAALAFHGLGGFWATIPDATDSLFLVTAVSFISTTLYLLMVRRSHNAEFRLAGTDAPQLNS